MLRPSHVLPSRTCIRRLAWSTILLAAITAGLLFQFGPPSTAIIEGRLLCSVALANGQGRLFVVEEMDGNLIEPYSVTLYRVDQHTNVFVCFLGDEYSHWWGCKLLPTTNSDIIELRTFGITQGFYSVTNGFTWVVGKRGPSPNYLVDGISVRAKVPEWVTPLWSLP